MLAFRKWLNFNTIRISDWILFWIWLGVNTFLAYDSASLPSKLFIAFSGLFFPFLWTWLSQNNTKIQKKSENDDKEIFPILSWPLGLTLVILAVFIRLYNLKSLTAWPMWDDADLSFFSFQLFEHWQWKYFFTSEQIPPLFFWLQSIFFRFCPPSLISFWIFPTFFSIATVCISYWVARQYFSRSLSWLFWGLMAFSYWPLYEGRATQNMPLLLTWECLAFGVLGYFLKSTSDIQKRFRILILGLCCAIGFYIFILWIPIFAVITIMLTIGLWKKNSWDWKNFFTFLITSLIPSLPLAQGLWNNISVGHVSMFLVSGHVSTSSFLIGTTLREYLTAIFWGIPEKSLSCFGPCWGGFLNPILDSLFFIGLLELFKSYSKISVWWIILGGFILISPGIFSSSLELMRILSLLPLVLLIVALGMQRLLIGTAPNRRLWVLSIFSILSISMDLYHWMGPYHDQCIPNPSSGDSKSAVHFRAFQILNELQKEEGPGYIFTEFAPDIFDQSLLIPTYPFNVARNPKYNNYQPQWAAILVHSNLGPYLTDRYPDCQNYWLSQELPSQDDGWILSVIPIHTSNIATFRDWNIAHQSIESLFGLMPYHTTNPSYEPAIQSLESVRPLFQKDYFLESCYLEKLANLDSKERVHWNETAQLLKTGINDCGSNPSMKLRKGALWKELADLYRWEFQDRANAIVTVQKAIQCGYQPALLYRQLAQLWVESKNFKQAQSAVQMAQKWDPQNPPPPELIRWLHQEATNQMGIK